MSNNNINDIEKAPYHIHDRFWWNTLENGKIAKEFFQSHLPANIRQVLNFESIKLESGNFIESNLRTQATDMLFSAQFGERQGYLYLLVEHQSTPCKIMPFRILRYTTAIMKRHLKEHDTEVLPVVYPLVVYSGNKPYNYSMDIFDLFGSNKDLAIDTLLKPAKLIKFNDIDDNKIQQYVFHGVIIKMMQHIYDADILPVMEQEVVPMLRNLVSSLGSDFVNTVIYYAMEAGEISDKEKFVNVLNTGLSKEFGEKAMTFAQQIKQEGRQEGIQIGEHKALESVAKKLLQLGEPMDTIVEATGLSTETIKKLLQK